MSSAHEEPISVFCLVEHCGCRLEADEAGFRGVGRYETLVVEIGEREGHLAVVRAVHASWGPQDGRLGGEVVASGVKWS